MTVNQPARTRAAVARTRRPSCRCSSSRRRRPPGSRQRSRELGPGGFRDCAARPDGARGHRHDACATRTSRCSRRACAPTTWSRSLRRSREGLPGAVLARGVGRRDLRRRAALLARGPVGATRRAARGGAQRLPADAAARPQHGRATRRTRTGWPTPSSQEAAAQRHRHLPHLRRLNDVDQMRPAIDAVLETGTASPRARSATPATLSNPAETALHARLLPARRRAARRGRVRTCCAIKDMAGLLRAPAAQHARRGAARCVSICPSTCTPTTPPGGQLATYLAAVDAGVDAVDGAAAPLSGTTSQPPLSAIVAATDHTPARDGPLARRAERPGALLGGACARSTRPSSAGCPRPTGRVYRHEIPGGQLSNLRQQASRARPRRPLRGGRGPLRGGRPACSAASSR